MIKISVLMSVYNETKEDLIKSIESVLNQTLTCFEFIIVNDNPNNTTLINVLKHYEKIDKRVKIIYNVSNLGLALSLNKAAEIATGEYFIRTDADDICSIDRFEKQYNFIKDTNYDLVCSDYYFIDELGEPINRSVRWYEHNSLKKLLPFHNVIHHPTVIMRASVFRSLNGYRNFPCAQDYDLWLRMLLNDCNFYMNARQTSLLQNKDK
ncbi:O-antigen biosynthesis glycosyltransferase WbnJ [Ureibacillus acetophenoni]